MPAGVRCNFQRLVPAGLQQLPSNGQRVLLAVVVVLELIEAFGYFTLNNIFTLHLTNELGYTDVEAGALFGARGSMTVVYTVIIGPAIDMIGPVRALPLGFALQALGRCTFAASTSRLFALLGVYGPMAIGHAMTGATLQIAVKRACTSAGSATESAGFALWYMALLVGISSCGWFIDIITAYQPTGPYRMLAFFAAGTAALGCFVSVIVFHYVSPAAADVADGKQLDLQDNINGCTGDFTGIRSQHTTETKLGMWLQKLKRIIYTRRFLRYLLFNIVLLPGFSVQRNLDGGIYPKYMLRTFGPTVPKGAIYSICAVGSLLLIPVCQRLAPRTPHFDMARPGILLMALSAWAVPFLRADRIVAPIVMMIMQAIGDAIATPRVYAYGMAVAPNGQEGSFGGVASSIIFLADIPTGVLGGYLLEAFCPGPDPNPSNLNYGISSCDGGAMFFFLGAFALTTPALLYGFPVFFREPDMHVSAAAAALVSSEPRPFHSNASNDTELQRAEERPLL